MGLISKITGHSDSSDSTHHNKHVESTQPTLDERTGTSSSASRNTATNSHTTGANTNAGTGNTKLDHHTGTRAAGQEVSSQGGDHRVQHAAPLTQEHVHDQYEHVDKTKRDEIHDQTEITQTVQPIYDEKTRRTERERVDHGTEVHEHGHRGLDRDAEAELARKREQIAREHKHTHDQETHQRSLRPDVETHERTNVVEEVVPVVQRDIYRPHEIEHDKRELHVHHEKPQFEGTRVAKPISVSEYEDKSNTKIHGFNEGDNPTRNEFTTSQHSHHGKHPIGHNGEVQEGKGVYEGRDERQQIGDGSNYSNNRPV